MVLNYGMIQALDFLPFLFLHLDQVLEEKHTRKTTTRDQRLALQVQAVLHAQGQPDGRR